MLDFSEHGFWIPLTVLFVLRPEYATTFDRLVLRATGTVVGLVMATAISEWLAGDGVAIAIVLTVATGLAYGMLTVQYALFTTAITTYAVLLADTLGGPAVEDAAKRGAATLVGITITLVLFLLWPTPRGRGLRPAEVRHLDARAPFPFAVTKRVSSGPGRRIRTSAGAFSSSQTRSSPEKPAPPVGGRRDDDAVEAPRCSSRRSSAWR